MPNEIILDTIIADSAEKGVADLIKKLKDLEDGFIANVKQANNLNNAVANSKTQGEFQKNVTASNASTKAVVDNIEKERAAEIRLQQLREKNFDDFEKKLTKQNQSLATNNRAFVQLNQKYQDAIKYAKDVGAALGSQSQAYIDAAENVNKLGKQIDNINSPLGDFKNKIGGYANGITEAFGKTFGVLRQAAYILPGIGIAGIFNLIGEGIVSVFEKLDLFSKKLTDAQLKEKDFNDALASAEYSKAVEQLDSLVIQLDLAKQGFTDKDNVINAYNESIGKVAGNVDTLDEAEKGIVKNGKAFIDITLQKAVAELALAEAAKATYQAAQLQNKSLEEFSSLSSFAAGSSTAPGAVPGQDALTLAKNRREALKADQAQQIKDQQDLADKQIVIARHAQQAIADIQSKMGYSTLNNGADPIADLENKIANARLESIKISRQQIIDNEKKSYKDRITAAQDFQKASLGQLDNDRNLQTKGRKLSNDEALQIDLEYQNKVLALNNETAKKIRDLNTQQRKDKIADYQADIEQQKSSAKRIVDNPEADLDVRLQALTVYTQKSKELIKSKQGEELKNAGDNFYKIDKINKDAAKDETDIDNEVADKKLQINKAAQAQLRALLKDGLKYQETLESEAIAKLKEQENKRALDIQGNSSDAVEGLAEQLKKGIISQAEFAEKKKAIDDQSSMDQVDNEITAAKAIIDVRQGLLIFGIGSAKDLSKAEDDLTNLKIKKSKLATQQIVDDANKEEEARKHLHNKEKELAEDVATFIQTTVDASYQNRINKIKDLEQAVDDQATADKKAVDGSIMSAADKARKTQLIDARAAQQKKQLDIQAKKLARDQAVMDRAIAIARVTEQTIIAASAALTPPPVGLGPVAGIALASVIGAIGAVQIATILATPLPAFENGGLVYKTGPILTGEGGTELMIDPSGRLSLTPDHANVSMAQAGTRIINHKETVKMLSQPEKLNYAGGQAIDIDSLVNALNSGTNRTVKAIQENNKNVHPAVFAKIIAREQMRAQSWAQYENKFKR